MKRKITNDRMSHTWADMILCSSAQSANWKVQDGNHFLVGLILPIWVLPSLENSRHKPKLINSHSLLNLKHFSPILNPRVNWEIHHLLQSSIKLQCWSFHVFGGLFIYSATPLKWIHLEEAPRWLVEVRWRFTVSRRQDHYSPWL